MNRAAASVLRFPDRAARCIRIVREAAGGWLVLARGHGWIHGDRRSARSDAQWLGLNLGLPIREIKQTGEHDG
jgi:hypothetical protein